jgi:predicted esterase
MGEEHWVETTTHGRFLVEEPRELPLKGWIVTFHGYGEGAEDALEELRRLPGSGSYQLCAVEGLHRFYRQRTGEVVASWMTKQGRELAMADNVAYVGKALAQLGAQLTVPADSVPGVFVGFSQGVAMAYRAAVGCGVPVSALIALAGDVPPELGPEQLRALPRVLLGRGDGDAWYTADKLAADEQRLRAAGVEVTAETFTGGHEWTPGFRESCGRLLSL